MNITLLQAAMNPFWDSNLLDLINGIKDAISSQEIPTVARQVAAILTLIYFSVKSYSMLTGEGQLEIMTLFRPFIFAIVIINFSLLTDIYDIPGNSLAGIQEDIFKAKATDIDAELAVKTALSDSVWNKMTSNIEELKHLYGDKKQEDFNPVEDVVNDFSGGAYDVMINLDTYVTVYQNLIFAKMNMAIQRFVTSMTLAAFKGVCYCIFFIQLIILYILKSLGPLSFAFSVTGPFRDSWVQWTSKYIAATFYNTIAFIVLNLALAIIEYGIGQEVSRLQYLVNLPLNEQFLKALQNYDAYYGYLIVALITTIAGIMATPAMASWIIQAGSGIGSYASSIGRTLSGGATTATKAAATGGQSVAASAASAPVKAATGSSKSPWN